MVRHLFLVLFTLLGCANAANNADSFTAKVIGVKDGDTIEVLKDGKPLVIRFADVDCPEKSQPFSAAAKKYTSDFCYGRVVTIVSDGKYDRYKRLIGTVMLNGISLNRRLVINGYAWHFKKYSKSQDFAQLEITARENKVGLWADKNPIPPWEWRKGKK